MICKHCRAWIDDDSVFCESCGSRVMPEGNDDETQDLSTILKQEIDSGIKDFDDLMSLNTEPETTTLDLDKTLIFHKTEPSVEPEIEEEAMPVDVIEPPTETETEQIQDEEPENQQEMENTFSVIEAMQEEPDESIDEPFLEAETPEIDEPEISEDDTDDLEIVDESEIENETKTLFCMACGKELPQGAAFCAICGTPTGEVAPIEIHRRRNKPSIAIPLLKGYFPNPEETIEQAASEDAMSIGAAFFVVKAFVLAIISAIFTKPLTTMLGESWFTAGDAFGFAAKVFLGVIIFDALLVALLFGAGILLKQSASARELLGACGIAHILPSVLWVITLILAATAPNAALAVAMIAVATASICTAKAVDAVYNTKGRNLYITISVAIVYIAALYMVVAFLI